MGCSSLIMMIAWVFLRLKREAKEEGILSFVLRCQHMDLKLYFETSNQGLQLMQALALASFDQMLICRFGVGLPRFGVRLCLSALSKSPFNGVSGVQGVC